MEKTIVRQIVLEAILRLQNERTDRSLFHLLQGKRSATSLQDAHFYGLEAIFGMLPLKKDRFEQLLQELEHAGWIKREQTLMLTDAGRAQISPPFLLDDLGGELRGYPIHLWKRISLMIQSIVCLDQNTFFIPVQQDSGVKEWVKQRIRQVPERSVWITTVYQELNKALHQLTEREAILISYRLSGQKTGLSFPQLSERLGTDLLSLQLEFMMAWRRCLRALPEDGLILSLGNDIDHLKMTQSAQKTWELLKQGYSVQQIAERRRLKKSTMEDHLVEIAMYATVFPTEQFVTAEQYEEVVRLSDQLHTFSLKRIKQELTQEMDYFQIRIVLARKVVRP
ncbi:helix-turn-helix domain-containing protein [Exiguobacterium artemiae]|uniref:helix-turn-helix domain-containing protein n=1 Tax=Exiguobacterium artemiae TaxID=340145 RepID=UPI00047B88ED|nr:helix-turn-helix domain-containing protein [Exiguobacterium sibiricum]